MTAAAPAPRPATPPPGAPRKLLVRTWGCQMNVYDSARMADVLAPFGYGPTDRPEEADLIILNTCHIREKATEKLYSELGRLVRAKQARRDRGAGDTLIAVAGCVAQAEGAEILARQPGVDLVFGPQTYHELPAMVRRVLAEGGGPVVNTEFPTEAKFDHLPEESAPPGPSAMLAVQEGCDKFCSFCVVPYTRGAEFSRPAAQVLAEARRLAAAGAREITLLGQNVNAWAGAGPDGRPWSLGRLIAELADIDGIARLRYTTSHPLDMGDDLIDAHATVPTLMPFVHLPVQSGSDRILAAMNRRHDRDAYRRVVDRLRRARPDLALSSDFIVGFPGESDRDFADTLALVDEIGFAQAYSFKYSARPGTPAAAAPGQVNDLVKAERLAGLQQLLSAQQLAFNKRAEGTTAPVLIERRGRRPGQVQGRSPHMQAVHVAGGDRLIGEIVEVAITAGHANSLAGTLAEMAP